MEPSKWIIKQATEVAKKQHPLETNPQPSPTNIVFAILGYLDNQAAAGAALQEQLLKKGKKK